MKGTRCFLVLSLFGALAAAAHAQGAQAGPGPDPAMLTGLSAEAVMDLANTWGMESDSTLSAWTTSRAIHFIFPDGTRLEIPQPGDRMVVSIAPYIAKTHPCKEHAPSRCRGELVKTAARVKAVASDGTVILDQQMETLANGFVDLWLPRNDRVAVTIDARGLTATGQISTSDADFTCVTTMKLGDAKDEG